MKRLFSLLIFVFFSAFAVNADSLEVGQKFPLEKITTENTPTDNTIIVFIPSLTEDCEYASMLTQSFYYYFDRQLAFDNLPKLPKTKIFFIVRDKVNAAQSMQNIFGKMNVIYDEGGKYFDTFGIPKPSSKNADSTVVLLDSSNTITLIDNKYRAQGEHLKPLENKLKELNGIGSNVKIKADIKELKVGETAPDFSINESQKLSDLRGKVVLISFYPAAFSGQILKKNDLGLLLNSPSSSPFSIQSTSCFIQIDLLDKKSLAKEEAKKILISNSTQAILYNWQRLLNTRNIIYANDPDYSISLKYNSFNPNGYNNRVTVIVDRKGKIAFIDKSFENKDEKIINAKLNEMLMKN
ncbi:MAG: peroxiredoxin family protein [Pyrinomonadaceae bacterium]|nr:peroxiredoxin family protein [Pyrinomonadaceae bacterium]